MTVYQTIFRPVLTFGSESWVMTKRQKNRIQATQIKYHKRALGVTKRHHKRNDDIREELACKRLSSSTGGICYPGVNKGIGQQISTPATKMESTVREL
jgi:hypothetical protein